MDFVRHWFQVHIYKLPYSCNQNFVVFMFEICRTGQFHKADSREHNNETSGSVKGSERTDQLSNY
jgi:hypothetical protein